MMFYGVLWLVARRLPVRHRLLMAVLLEAGWEVLENSPFIMQRYRPVTISLGYVGDSVLNSLSDILMMSAGFLFAAKARVWVTVAVFAAIKAGCALWVRNNLTEYHHWSCIPWKRAKPGKWPGGRRCKPA